MKKVLSVVLVLVVLLMGTACFKNRPDWTERREAAFVASFETDGVLLYYHYLNVLDKFDEQVYDEKYDYYSVVGTVDNKEDMTIYVPPYFNGKPVNAIGYKYIHGFGTRKNYQIPDQKRVYLPYTLYRETNSNSVLDSHESFRCEESLFTVNNRTYAYNNYAKKVYMNALGFKRYIEKKKDYLKDDKITDYYLEYLSTGKKFIIANTAYMFNYEDAPNNNYFFINEFERGGLIEDTPYKPIREGYEFAGWYKEPECETPWNFETDTLPDAEYKEDGELIFIETKLYAKWIKE